MESPEKINQKITELSQWLQDNPDHPNRTIIESDLRNAKSELLKLHDDNTRNTK